MVHRLKPIRRCRIIAYLRFARNGRRDPGNWYATLKPIVDALVHAGVLPDDDTKHVTGPDLRLWPTTGEPAVILRLIPDQYGEGSAQCPTE